MVVVSILGLIILLFTYKVIWPPDEISLAPCNGFKIQLWSRDVIEFAKCHVILTWAY